MKAVVYMIIFLSFTTEVIQCSCLSYGHSCWGGHGKRSGVAAAAAASDRVEMASNPDRWTLFKIIQDENDNIYQRNVRLSQDDSFDYIEKKTQNDLIRALKKQQNLPLVILSNAAEENVGSSQEVKQLPMNPQKRRSDTSASSRDYLDAPLPTAMPENLLSLKNIRMYKLLTA